MLSALLKESIFQSGWRCPEKFAGSFKLLTKFATIFKRVTNFPESPLPHPLDRTRRSPSCKNARNRSGVGGVRKTGRLLFQPVQEKYWQTREEHQRAFRKEANSLVWLWDYANRSQALFRELYPALKQIQSNYSGRCYDYGHEFSYVIGMARDVLINHTRDVDINEPDGPTNLSAWVRLKNKELPPSLHRY